MDNLEKITATVGWGGAALAEERKCRRLKMKRERHQSYLASTDDEAVLKVCFPLTQGRRTRPLLYLLDFRVCGRTYPTPAWIFVEVTVKDDV